MKKEELLSVAEFAKRAGRAEQTIYTMLAVGELESQLVKQRNRPSNKIPVSELRKIKKR